MQQDEISQDGVIEMARQTGDATKDARGRESFDFDSYGLEAFAKLVRNDYSNKHAQLWLKRIDKAVKEEREACAKFFDDNDTLMFWGSQAAREIRARGEPTSRGKE